MTTHANCFDSPRESQKSAESISRSRYHAIAEPKAFGGLQVGEGREPFSGIEAI
jgi:hypothetical protein